jgi:hypothetical protein
MINYEATSQMSQTGDRNDDLPSRSRPEAPSLGLAHTITGTRWLWHLGASCCDQQNQLLVTTTDRGRGASVSREATDTTRAERGESHPLGTSSWFESALGLATPRDELVLVPLYEFRVPRDEASTRGAGFVLSFETGLELSIEFPYNPSVVDIVI